jgi:hypothetical protein
MHKFQLIYPFKGDKIYESKSKKKAIKKCYQEFKFLNDNDNGIFTVTDINKNKDLSFKIINKNNKKKQLIKFNFEHTGGDSKLNKIIESQIDKKFDIFMSKVEKMIDMKLLNSSIKDSETELEYSSHSQDLFEESDIKSLDQLK